MLWVGTEHLISGTDLIPFIGTLVLVAAAASLLFFGHGLRIRIMSCLFIASVVLTSHAVDRYFWGPVWQQRYPWPFGQPNGAGLFVGSIEPFIGQVSIVTFSVLLFIGCVMAAWHLTSLPPSAAEL